MVIGQLTTRLVSEGRTLYFLERLEHPETGVGLEYPGGSGPVQAFVYAADAVRLDASTMPKAIAELQLSPTEQRGKRMNPYACSVRAGTLRELRVLPQEWNVAISGTTSVRSIADAAFSAIEKNQQERQAQLDAHFLETERHIASERKLLTDEVAQLERAKISQEEAVREAQQEAMNMKERSQRLSDLLVEKGRRLVAMGLLGEPDLLALLPHAHVPIAQPSHDFQQLLGSDFARLAPFVQARLWKKGMLFTQAQLRDFLALLRTNDLIVLAGDSGSGKTSLIRTVAESIGGRCTVIPVKPNWTGPEDLMGYYNPIERTYQATTFLLALQAAQAEPDTPHFICLDEMNLARVEHYFADFLSLLEIRNGHPLISLYASD